MTWLLTLICGVAIGQVAVLGALGKTPAALICGAVALLCIQARVILEARKIDRFIGMFQRAASKAVEAEYTESKRISMSESVAADVEKLGANIGGKNVRDLRDSERKGH